MRTAFINELIRLARENPKVFLVVGDLGFSVVEPYVAEFPDRFLNAGVAEQNMTGIAAGLAAEGFHVFTYSIANFPTLRCLEQIRNDVCYHRLPVTVVAVGAGLAYGNLGYSHHAVQDIAVMRTLPEMTILSPADPGEARECTRWIVDNPRPSYLRIGKAGEKELHQVSGIQSGPLEIIAGNSDCALVCTGSILKIALDAAHSLKAKGVNVAVFSCPWLQPASREFFQRLTAFRRLVVMEEHLWTGGLGSLLRDNLPSGIEVTPLAVRAERLGEVGNQAYLRQTTGLTMEAAMETILSGIH